MQLRYCITAQVNGSRIATVQEVEGEVELSRRPLYQGRCSNIKAQPRTTQGMHPDIRAQKVVHSSNNQMGSFKAMVHHHNLTHIPATMVLWAIPDPTFQFPWVQALPKK
ncbi:hypothetical protein DM860_017986 [Cuscuta australis]|uniref:Uncharacterized protein n=1 Tax=Cuscuta australis TaxID=267555 RepID=A0A328EE03_9ASTE|nr:hypothetical protein DM860_017986 [Cuscuta australis]